MFNQLNFFGSKQSMTTEVFIQTMPFSVTIEVAITTDAFTFAPLYTIPYRDFYNSFDIMLTLHV